MKIKRLIICRVTWLAELKEAANDGFLLRPTDPRYFSNEPDPEPGEPLRDKVDWVDPGKGQGPDWVLSRDPGL